MADEQEPKAVPEPGKRGTRKRNAMSWQPGKSGNPRGKAHAKLKLLRAAHEADAQEVIDASPSIADLTDPRCTVCQSPLRVKIERWRVAGMGFRGIERRLKERYGEEYAVSHWAIQRHFQNHVIIADLEAAYYATQRAEVDAATAESMSELQRLEAERTMLHRRMNDVGEDIETLRDTGKAVTLPLVNLFLGCSEEARHRSKMITDLRGAQPGDEVDVMLARLWQVLPPAQQPDAVTPEPAATVPATVPQAAEGDPLT